MPDIRIRVLEKEGIQKIVEAFAKANWPKPASIFNQYLQEQDNGERLVWLAYINDAIAGYCTLNFKSKYPAFSGNNIPEIMDLNVLPAFRKLGIGSALLDEAESNVKNSIVGIGVGLYDGYGSAQKLYIKRGYVPDGMGITYNYQRIKPGNSYPVDDDLVLWLVKKHKLHLEF